MMRRLLRVLAVAAMVQAVQSFGTPAAQAQAEPALRVAAVESAQQRGRVVEETVLDRQTREISAQLRCVVCQGLSLQDSPSQLAQEMRAIVREKLEEGMTAAEVKEYFVERYGEWVLLQPEPRGFNLLVYILPVAMFFGGAGFIFLKARSWTRHGGAADAPESDGRPADAPESDMRQADAPESDMREADVQQEA